MTRKIKASEIKKGMEIQLRMEVDSILGRDVIAVFQEDGQRAVLPASLEVEVLREAGPDEPAPGSVVRTAGGDVFCRVESLGTRWLRVNGTGMAWTWRDILTMVGGDVEIVFNSEGR